MQAVEALHEVFYHLKTHDMNCVTWVLFIRTHTHTLLHPFTSSPLMNILIVPPQKESVASFLRGHQRWAVQAFCINNKFIMHECGPLL